MPSDEESEGMTWKEVTAIRDAHVGKQEKEKAEWQAKQDEMIKLITARSKRNVDDEPHYNWLEPDADEPEAWAGSIDVSKYKFMEDDHLKHENDKYYKKMGDSLEEVSDEDDDPFYYVPVNEMDPQKLTERWKIFNKTDNYGNHLIGDNYYALLNGLNYNKTTLDKILEDIIDSKVVPGKEDLIPDAFPDYEDLDYQTEVKRKRRSVGNSNRNDLPIYNLAKVVFRHFEANKEGIKLARNAIKLAGAVNDALASSSKVNPDKVKVMKATVDVTKALDNEFNFVDVIIANNEVLSKALEEARATAKKIDTLYKAASANIITSMKQGPVAFRINDKLEVSTEKDS